MADCMFDTANSFLPGPFEFKLDRYRGNGYDCLLLSSMKCAAQMYWWDEGLSNVPINPRDAGEQGLTACAPSD